MPQYDMHLASTTSKIVYTAAKANDKIDPTLLCNDIRLWLPLLEGSLAADVSLEVPVGLVVSTSTIADGAPVSVLVSAIVGDVVF